MNGPEGSGARSGPRFRVFPQFEQPELAGMIRSRHRLGPVAAEVFAGDRVQDRLVQALAERRVMNTKEVLESFAFHRCTRKRLRRSVVVDLCCGHGLTGVLFALLETRVKHVFLVDNRRPASVAGVLDAAISLAPWVAGKITILEQDALLPLDLPMHAGVLGVHACGGLTDRVIELGLQVRGPIAVMPCCYRSPRHTKAKGIVDTLGVALAVDIERTQRMTSMGLQVDWQQIPTAITPMSRILIGWRPTGDYKTSRSSDVDEPG